MATLYLKMYPPSPNDRLIDGTEDPKPLNCYVDDDFLSKIYDVIGNTKVMVYADESGECKSDFPCITGKAIEEVKYEAEKYLDKLIIETSRCIEKGDDRKFFYAKLRHMTEFLHLIDIKQAFNNENDLAILQLEP